MEVAWLRVVMERGDRGHKKERKGHISRKEGGTITPDGLNVLILMLIVAWFGLEGNGKRFRDRLLETENRPVRVSAWCGL